MRKNAQLYVLILSLIGCGGTQRLTTVDDIYSALPEVLCDWNWPLESLSSSDEIKQNSRQEFIRTGGMSFVAIYPDMEKTQRGMGGNGPVFVYVQQRGDYRLVYRNFPDEMVNRVEIVAYPNSRVQLHAYAHVGLASGLQEPIVYEWNGTSFVYGGRR